jgi:hypothetical protein
MMTRRRDVDRREKRVAAIPDVDRRGRALRAQLQNRSSNVAPLAGGGEHRFDYDHCGRIIETSTDVYDGRKAYEASGRPCATA